MKEEVVAPYWANNTRGEVLALLNLYPFEQYIHWEKCTFEHRQMYCREGCRYEETSFFLLTFGATRKVGPSGCYFLMSLIIDFFMNYL